jgi:hypothetical protein
MSFLAGFFFGVIAAVGGIWWLMQKFIFEPMHKRSPLRGP